ncbi:MAG: GDP-mannose 4,6-dehydratase [Gemmatimonadales bacterium]
MHYLITGGAGFIGSHLAEALLARGDRVTVLDDLSTGSIRNIQHLKAQPGFRYVIERVENAPLTAEMVDDADQVFHLAAAVGVRLIVESPVRTIETNVKTTELVLAAACKKKKKVFVASTSEVYGKSAAAPFREDGDLVLGPTSRGRWSYACSKAIDEFLAIAYWRERRCPTLVGRCFNTVGPRQTGHYGMVVPRFVRQALKNEPITVYGDGTQSRCFTHVSDCVRAMIGLMDSVDTVGEVYNIGSQQEVTILDLAERIKAATESESDITLVPYEQVYGENFEDMPRRVPSIEKIAKAIGYEPRVTLEETLQSVVEYQQSLEPQPA